MPPLCISRKLCKNSLLFIITQVYVFFNTEQKSGASNPLVHSPHCLTRGKLGKDRHQAVVCFCPLFFCIFFGFLIVFTKGVGVAPTLACLDFIFVGHINLHSAAIAAAQIFYEFARVACDRKWDKSTITLGAFFESAYVATDNFPFR